ncbi:MAG: asparagine synthase (glutamine-hydrolyzing) [Planctomycetes bacterium]|nr:asparagine synthase (glutamine-hydrolyzing) [Planctomycetota bacterium]
MCGIAGIVAPGPAGGAEESRVTGMLETLRHRGPDGFGRETRGRAVLGHARLAIIDLRTGDQPQSDANDRYHVVCNGEIYNYKELRRELESRGHVFRTQSDVEVIPHLYEEMGDRCVDRLRGMFAFALHDVARDRTLLARDRLGKKPLYWARSSGGLAFASEARALAGLDGVDTDLDPEAVDLYLTLQYIPAPWSIHKGIRKLEAATSMAFERDGSVRMHRYWDPLPEPDEGMTEAQALDEIDAVLRESSRIRLRSDVPVSSFLSGGIDSGLVVSYLSEEAPERMSAITVGFGGAPEDEGVLTRSTAVALGVDLEEEHVELDVPSVVNAVVGHMDEPHGDSSCVPTWLVSRAAARRVKVVLSGDGGDEAFAGYATRYSHNLATETLRRWIPGGLRRGLAGGLARIWPRSGRLPRPLRLGNLLDNLSRDLEGAYARDMTVVRPALKARLYGAGLQDALGSFDSTCVLRDAFDRTRGHDPLSRLLYVDRHTYLSEGVIAKVDRMSMAHSLEVRSPLLDQKVVELAARIPSSLKIRGGTGKLCLRKLAARRLPREVVRAKKSGFAPPLAAWIRGPLYPLVRERLAGGALSSLLDLDVARRLLEEHKAGRRDWARPLWLLFVLASWADARCPAGIAT